MQISKIAVFAVACGLAALTAQADQDNPDQAAARAALVSRLFDVSAASTVPSAAANVSMPSVSAPAVSTTTVVKPAVTAQPVVRAQPVSVSTPPATSQKKPVVPAAAAQSAAKPVSEFAPIQAPSSPLSATKQQRLADLLAKYKTDQISPEEYHRQRAAIVNGM